jgi:hypothetical protein
MSATATARTAAKLGRFAVATVAFLALLGVIYAAHVRWFVVEVVLYSALFDGLVALALIAPWLYRARYLAVFNGFEKLLVLACWGLLAFVYAFSIPTVIDRSLSFYMLEKIQQNGGALRQDRFEQVFTTGYAREHRLVDMRLTEQLASGTVTIEQGCVRLTARGQRLADFSRAFRRHLLPRRRLLMGTYTEALADPMRGGPSMAGADCSLDPAGK